MEYLCPLCNGLIEYMKKCEKCGCEMSNSGRIQDFYDDYSPYLGYNITDVMDGEPSDICQHLFTCPQCGCDHVENIHKVLI